MDAKQIHPVHIVSSYAREDDDLRKQLKNHLSALIAMNRILLWFDCDIQAGAEKKSEIVTQFKSADIILLLISSDFMASHYCNGNEVQLALDRHKGGRARIIPILLRPVSWEDTSIGHLQCLPSNRKPVTKWKNRDEAFLDIEHGIRELIKTVVPKQSLLPKETAILYPLQANSHLLRVALQTPSVQQSKHVEKFCDSCGAANSLRARFCRHCAAPFPFKHTTGSQPEQTLPGGYSQLLPGVSVSRLNARTTIGVGTVSNTDTTGTAGVGNSLLQDAYRLYAQERLLDALHLYDRALKTEKQNPLAWQGRALVQAKRGLHRDALSSFNRALKLDPNLVISLNGKGTALNMLHCNEEALEAFERAILLEEDNVTAWNGKGLVLQELGRASESLQAYQEALKIDAKYLPALCGIGDVYYSQRKLRSAYEQYEKALQSDPNYVEVWEKRAVVLADGGDYPKALESYDKALSLDPRYASAWNGKASLLCTMEQYQQALYAYNQALLYNANAAQSWNGKGNALYHLRDYQSALDAYEQALQLEPCMVSALHNKSLVLKELRRYEEALEAAESAIEVAPDDSDNWLRKAEALKKLRRGREAHEAEIEVARLRRGT